MPALYDCGVVYSLAFLLVSSAASSAWARALCRVICGVPVPLLCRTPFPACPFLCLSFLCPPGTCLSFLCSHGPCPLLMTYFGPDLQVMAILGESNCGQGHSIRVCCMCSVLCSVFDCVVCFVSCSWWWSRISCVCVHQDRLPLSPPHPERNGCCTVSQQLSGHTFFETTATLILVGRDDPDGFCAFFKINCVPILLAQIEKLANIGLAKIGKTRWRKTIWAKKTV